VLSQTLRDIDTSYAVGHAKGIFASGRVEDLILFHKKFCTSCKIFCEKDKPSIMLPQANPAAIA
jgi:hypothetical protein